MTISWAISERLGKKITITDPYIRLFIQARNLMELMETLIKQKSDEDEIEFHLVTSPDEIGSENQAEFLEKIQQNVAPAGIHFTWEMVEGLSLHARHIVTDHGWKILLDRGLDIFQRYESNDPLCDCEPVTAPAGVQGV